MEKAGLGNVWTYRRSLKHKIIPHKFHYPYLYVIFFYLFVKKYINIYAIRPTGN